VNIALYFIQILLELREGKIKNVIDVLYMLNLTKNLLSRGEIANILNIALMLIVVML
jgi:hypothetical protein